MCLRVRLKNAGGMQVCASTSPQKSPLDKAQARASFVPSETQLQTIGTACSCEFDAVRVVHARLMLRAALNVAHLRFKDLVRAQISYVEACVSCGTGSGPVIM